MVVVYEKSRATYKAARLFVCGIINYCKIPIRFPTLLRTCNAC